MYAASSEQLALSFMFEVLSGYKDAVVPPLEIFTQQDVGVDA